MDGQVPAELGLYLLSPVVDEVLNLIASICMLKTVGEGKSTRNIKMYKGDILHQTWQALLDAVCNNSPLPSICSSLKGIGRSVVPSGTQWPKTIVVLTMFLMQISRMYEKLLQYIELYLINFNYYL